MMTVEDPVEYQVPGVTRFRQTLKRGLEVPSLWCCVHPVSGPDVIMVGEIRDNETARSPPKRS